MRRAMTVITCLAIWQGSSSASATPPEWERLDVGLQESVFTAVAIHPTLPARIFAASQRTFYESHDGGQRWQSRFRAPEGASVTDIDISADMLPVMLVATDRGLYGSFDEGTSWSLLFQGKDQAEMQCTYVAFHPTQPAVVLLGTHQGLFMSEDRARHWKPVHLPAAARDVIHFAFDPTHPDFLPLVSTGGLFVGNLQRGEWQQRFRVSKTSSPEAEEPLEMRDEISKQESPLHRVTGVALDPRHPSILYLATSRGVLLSRDSGVTWRPLTNTGLESRMVSRVLLQTHSPRVLYAATAKGVARYEPQRTGWTTITQGLTSTQINDLVVTHDHLWAATNHGLYHYALPPEAFDNSPPPMAHELLADLSYEPTIAQVREAAIRYAEVHPDKIQQWRRQAAWRAVLPTVDLGMDHRRSRDSNLDQGTFPKFQVIETEDRDAKLGLSVKWDLANLIWNSDQTSIDARSRFMVELRNDIVDQVTRAYFERRRLQTIMLTDPPNELRASLEQELRLEELTALLDGLTGGYFSRSTAITHN